jgi:hypothetical protein
MAPERLPQVACGSIPDSDRFITRSRRHPRAVVGERDRDDRPLVASERMQQLARIGVPDSNLLISRR